MSDGLDEAATTEAMRLAQLAIKFDQGQRYDEAMYFYLEAANQLLNLLKAKKTRVILRKNAEEYINRVEFLKKNLDQLRTTAKKGKTEQQLIFENVEFLTLKAEDLERKGHISLALDEFQEAIGICLKAANSTDLFFKEQMRAIAKEALSKAESLKRRIDEQRVTELTQQLPDVPKDGFSDLRLDDKLPSGRGVPASASPSPSPSTSRKAEGLSKEELAVLATTSNINGKLYVPFLSYDLQEKFHLTLPFTDKEGKIALSEKQKKRLKGWLRPEEIFETPTLVKCIDSGTIKQTVVSDCSFVSSLSIAARYERRFNKQLITSIIYPQNKAGQPVYNSSGKYMIKLHINGVWRKVIIDDFLPVGDNRELLCSHSQQPGELWVSLLEKAYLKVMGGYDFPGSNSSIDMHALTGWIPERIAIRKGSPEFDADKVFEKLLLRFHSGDCLITLATGKLSKDDCDRAGLVDSHAYALLDLRKIDGKRLLMVKNPWTHLRWKGRFSENDVKNWTPELMKTLDYDPSRAKEKDDGVFWIDYESVCHFFDVFYVNWNPALFPFTYGLHAKWDAGTGPVKDLYSIADNPQYCLEVNNKIGKAAVWILLTRHITEISDFADNKEYITVMVYKSGKKVYIPFDPKPLFDGVRINSPHYLCQMVVTDPGINRFTLAVAQYEKMNTIYYTLRVYSSTDFSLTPIKKQYPVMKKETGQWKGKTAGGCGNAESRNTYKNNPLYEISLDESSDENSMFIELKGPKEYSVGVEFRQASSKRTKFYETKDSGSFKPGYNVLVVESIPAGVYHLRVMTFLNMSRVVKLPGADQWTQADLSRADFNDAELGFLGSFEEYIPGAETKKKAKKKKEKPKEKKNNKTAEKRKTEKQKEEVEEDGEPRKKKSKKGKKKKGKQPVPEEVQSEDEQSETNAVDSEQEGGQSEDEEREDKEDLPPCDTSAWKEFNLPLAIIKAIGDLRFSQPTEIQKLVLPEAIGEGNDILGAAETGSGKTLAFAAPLAHRLLTDPKKSHGPRALIVAPTRELAVQIMKHVKAILKYTAIRVTHLIGGLAVQKQERLIDTEPDILIATPGRLWQMMESAEKGSYLKDFSALQCLVIDEMDRMVEDNHFEELAQILEYIKLHADKSQLQTMVFSATLTFVTPNLKKKGDENKKLSTKEKIQRLVEIAGLRKGKKKVIDVTKEFGMAGAIQESRINCDNLLEKDTTVIYLLYNLLSLLKMEPLLLHADMAQRQRLRSIEAFAKVPNSTLIATDVAARGLDIKGVDHVIHYNVPVKAEMYIHRSGRTARASASGKSILLIDPKSADLYRKLCRMLNRAEDLRLFQIDFPELMDTLRERVETCSELERVNYQRKKIRLKESWFEKIVREADLDEDDARTRERENDTQEMEDKRLTEKSIKKRLNALLNEPLPRFEMSKSGRSGKKLQNEPSSGRAIRTIIDGEEIIQKSR
ncbi:hypothetical protein WR25_08319 [Diploscapter pachys]|uniref:RNA helicase n=1 Tax=Diploscapter pachys TaxID=2018661 RepID=A0A2A2L077_9BILA|nr:hypothetical protein WR25_08319 [Diploscapter pachys]